MASTRGAFPAARGPVSRSMTVDLREGMTDGKVRKRYPDRGGPPAEPTTAASRADLDRDLYGVQGDSAPGYVNQPDAVEFLPRF